MPKPSPTTYPPYFQKYIDQVPDEDLLAGFDRQAAQVKELLGSITEQKSTYAYAPEKWTLKDLLQHVIDTERIFCFRALCFARNETFSLPGFDENSYAANTHANERTWQSLTAEFLAVRAATELLFKSFDEEELSRMGTANNIPTSTLSMGFISLGHFAHHKKIIEERYF
jgi:uncharacterized damage-inducible protein DinB